MKKLVLALTLIAGLLMYYWGRVEIMSRFTPEYPAQLIDYSTIYHPNPTRKWKISQMQPMIVGYASYDERNYLLIVYPDDGKLERAMVLLNGRIDESNIDKIAYTRASGEKASITFDELKKLTSIGQRIHISYLGEYPFDWEDENKEFCTIVTPVCQYPVVLSKSEEIINKSWILRPKSLFAALSLSESLMPLEARNK